MKTRQLGRTGLQVPIVGIGTAFLGYNEPEEAAAGKFAIDEDVGIRALHTAVEAGCTLVDTAPLYAATHAESVVGQALRARPDLARRCTVTSKAGRLKEGKDYSRDAIRRSVFASLERLGLERLEVVSVHDAQGHSTAEVLGRGGALAALRELQSEGVIGFVGTACSEPDTNVVYVETGEFDVAVVADAWSLLNQQMAQRILPAAEKYNVGIIIATPLERGLLATGPMPGRVYQSRQFSPQVLEHVTRIQRLCMQHGISLLAAALQWLTRAPQVASAIPGARTPQEAQANADAGAVDIPPAFWNDLEPLVRHWEIDRGKAILYR